MVQIIPQASLGTGIAQGLASGLSEQLPKEIAQRRLSKGLRDLAGQDFTGKSPMEQLAALYGIYGMTPELAAQAQQYLQNQAFFGSQPPSTSTTGQPLPTGGQPQPSLGGAGTTPDRLTGEEQFEIPSLSGRSSNYGIPSEQPEIETMARQEHARNPNKFRTWQEYLNYAESQDQKRVNKQQEYQKRSLEADQYFNTGVQEMLQKEGKGIYADLPGELAINYKNKIKQKVDQGKPADVAANEVLKEVLPLVQARNDMAEATGFFQRMFKKPTDVRKSLNSARDVYKKAGALKTFRNDLIAEGVSDPYANYLAFPTKDHKEVHKYLSSLPKVKPASIISGTYEAGEIPKNKKKGKTEIQIADELSDIMDKQDSVLSIALSLNGRGYDGQAFINRMRELNAQKDFLTTRQAEDLTKNPDFKPRLMDAYLFAKLGLDPIEVQP